MTEYDPFFGSDDMMTEHTVLRSNFGKRHSGVFLFESSLSRLTYQLTTLFQNDNTVEHFTESNKLGSSHSS